MTPPLLTVTGTDGAGKSLITRRLRERLVGKGMRVARLDKWDIYDFERHPECRFLNVPLATLRRCISEMSVPGRTLFLFWTLHTAVKAIGREPADMILLDSYWIKHAASEQLYGAPESLIRELCAELPPSTAVFLLDIDPSDAWARKAASGFADVVPYECGMCETPNEDSFTQHQRRLRDILRSWAAENGWIVIDANRAPDDIVDMIIARLVDSGVIAE